MNVGKRAMIKKTMKPQTLKGFRDFSSEELELRYKVIDTLKEVFSLFGFSPLETPAIEGAEILKGKYGQEADKLLYTFTDRGEREIGLRYDLTVPLSRYIAQNSGTLTLPFKRYQIQPVWRAENTQRGRYREFWQCDVDIVGSSSPLADAEILAVTSAAFDRLGLSEIEIKVNSRTVLFRILAGTGIQEDEKQLSIIRAIDKLAKIGKNGVVSELTAQGFEPKLVDALFKNIGAAQPDENLKAVFQLLENYGLPKNRIQFEPTLARGLDYYTGIIFEVMVSSPPIGSLAGGGRYDNLIAKLGGPDLPATGIALGFERITEVLKERNAGKKTEGQPKSCLVAPITESELPVALKLAQKMRGNLIRVEIYPEVNAKIDKQLKYADRKGLDYTVIIGPEEAAKNSVILKNLRTKNQKAIPSANLSSELSKSEN